MAKPGKDLAAKPDAWLKWFMARYADDAEVQGQIKNYETWAVPLRPPAEVTAGAPASESVEGALVR